MRSEPSTVNTAESRTPSLAGRRREAARKQKLRRSVLETLEPRTLLAVIPATQVSAQVSVAAQFEPSNANCSSPSIAVDPTNPQHLVAVWQSYFPVTGGTVYRVDGAYSSNGGTSWSGFTNIGSGLSDPTTSNPVLPYAQVTDGSVDFDRSGNFYIVVSAHNAAGTSGSLVLNKYSTSSGSPSNTISDKILYTWTQDVALKPMIAVDKSVKSFSDTYTDQNTGNTVTKLNTDATAGNVYVAWETIDTAPSGAQNWNPNVVRIIGSSDGGQSFGGARTVTQGGTSGSDNFGSQREGTPRLVVLQGTPTTSGGTATVAGGTVEVLWDDWGSGATASPYPFDIIGSRSYTGLVSKSFTASPGFINDAGPNNTPTTTPFPISVPVGTSIGGNVTDVTISVALLHPADSELTLALQAPDGTVVTLVANGAASGANFGYNLGGGSSMLYTTFNQNNDHLLATGAAPYIGTFRPSGNLATFNNKALQTGTWQLLVTDSTTTTNQVAFLYGATLSVTGGFTGSTIHRAATTYVRGQQGAGGLVASAADPFGIGPAPEIAADNTLGGNSPYAGRLYMVYVDRSQTSGNPSDNTDIYMKTSDDGGATWSGATQVNDDFSQTDGFSDAYNSSSYGGAGMSGREQFEPAVAVDQETGTLVVTFYDGRYDAARARVVQTIATSIDGGGSFTPQNGNYANASQWAWDQAANNYANLGPIPDNDSSGNTATNKENVFGFGDRQGLAVLDGHMYPAWSSNSNGGDNGQHLLDIAVAQANFTAGPRIISGTEGPVGLPGDSLNGSRTADGTPIAQAFIVTFDRDVDPATFTPAEVTVVQRDLTGAIVGYPTVLSVVPTTTDAYGASAFQVNFTPSSTPGTYSYTVGPDIADRIRYANASGTQTSAGNKMDQNANGTTDESTGDKFQVPAAAAGNTAVLTAPYATNELPLIIPGPYVLSYTAENQVNGAADHEVLNATTTYIDVTFDRDMNPLTLVGNNLNAQGQPSVVLQIMGPSGLVSLLKSVNGVSTSTVSITQTPGAAYPDRTFRITFPKQQLSGTYTLTLNPAVTTVSGVTTGILSAQGYALDTNMNAGVDALRGTSTSAPVPVTYKSSGASVLVQPGATGTSSLVVPDNFVIQDTIVQVNITTAYDPAISATLIAPDGTSVLLFQNVGKTGTQANFSGTIFDDSASTPITNGGPPFYGRFQPIGTLSSFNNRSSYGTNGKWTLQVTNASSGKTATIGAWNLTLSKPTSGTGLGEPIADRPQLSFRVFVNDPTNPISSTTWTSVGPADIGGIQSGRVGAIAVDPSDPSGNTVYVGAASGGVWKTNNFLTTDAAGPTYVPLTDFGPTSGINVGSIAVFARNNDPNQSIVVVATGDGDGSNAGDGVSSPAGVGFLISANGGATWSLMDSTDNTKAYASRDHAFVGSTAYKVVVDPHPTTSGDVIIYAALSGNNGGLWRSLDTGKTWGVLNPTTGARSANLPGNATDVVLDLGPASATKDAVKNPTGNAQVVYGAIQGQGVYISPNQGQVWHLMSGGTGDPLIQDVINPGHAIPVTNTSVSPNGLGGRIVLGKPAILPSSATDASFKNALYENWLYAEVAGSGLYVTKDAGQNWTKVRLPNDSPLAFGQAANPSNNTSSGDVAASTSNYTVSIAVDPNNPDVVYIGGNTTTATTSGLIRVDITKLSDSYSFYLKMDSNDGGTFYVNSTDAVTLKTPINNWLPNVFAGFPPYYPTAPGQFFYSDFDPRTDAKTSAADFTDASGNPAPYWGRSINLIRLPADPESGNSTFYVSNVASFANSGSGATWTPVDVNDANIDGYSLLNASTDFHRMVAMVDPLTGLTRLIVGDDNGVYSGVEDSTGTLNFGIGTAAAATGSRNGNLQTTQFYYGAAQPSNSAGSNATIQGLIYGNSRENGFPYSNTDVLSAGDTTWNPFPQLLPVISPGSGGGVATDQTGSGTVYQYKQPGAGGNYTDFFQVDGVGRTNGLLQTPNDPQWPLGGVANFAVNPINGDQIIIGSFSGRIFRTLDQGRNWLSIGEPSVFGNSQSIAMAFGAPDPSAPTVGSQADFIYVGTKAGHMYVTFTGGGSAGQGNAWYDITNGALANDGSTIESITTNPTRGSREAYAVTDKGVYYISDSNPTSGATWVNITSNLFNIQHTPVNFTANYTNLQLTQLTSIVADWRYVIPNATGTGTHPMLYVAGNAGVYRSTDQGATWALFPQLVEAGSQNTTSSLNIPSGNGGGLPLAKVTDLDLSIGNVDPTTGRSIATAGDPNILLATTYGRGSFSIRLAPLVLNDSTNKITLDPTLPAPSGSAGGGTAADGTPLVTISQPYIDGLSEQTAFGNVVRITFWDLTDPTNPRIVGGYNPNDPTTDIAANRTDAFGKFSIQLNAGAFTTNGLKQLGIQATDLSGTQGNMALFAFTLKANLSNVNTPPAAPTISMLASDDSSGGLLVTNVSQPHFIGVTDPNVTVALYMSDHGSPIPKPIGSALDTTTSDAYGKFTLRFPNLGDGIYYVQTVATNAYGSSNSAAYVKFQIKHTAPTTPVTLSLKSSDDSGIVGDNITSIRYPHFTGTAEPGSKVQIYLSNNATPPAPSGGVLATTTADATTGAFTIQLPQALENGTIRLVAGETDLAGNQGPYSNQATVTIVTTQGDLIGAGQTTPTLFRRTTTGTALWLASGTVTTTGWLAGGVPITSTQSFGSSTLAVPFVGDFDGDGYTDVAVYVPSTNTWDIKRSLLGELTFTQGTAGSVPVAADFDGDGITDAGVYNPTTGVWTIAESTTGTVTLGPIITAQPGDIPVPGNYDNTGKAELAIYRPGTGTTGGTFFISTGKTVYTKVVGTGAAGDEPVPGDYNNTLTSRATEPAVYNPTTGVWAILGSTGTVTTVSPAFKAGDIPAPGDYLGNGSLQTAVYRPSTGTFYINNGGSVTTVSLGTTGDIPLTSPLVYRNVLATPTLTLAASSDTGIKGDNITSGRRDSKGIRWFDLTGTADPGVTVMVINQNNGNTSATTTADASGNFTVSLAGFYNGTYNFKAVSKSLTGATSSPSKTLPLTLITVDADYTGVGKTGQAVFSRASTALSWTILGLNGGAAQSFGTSTTAVPMIGDLDADGKTDLIYYVPSTAQWYAERSAFSYTPTLLGTWGWPTVDIPVAADYTGNGMTDIAVYRPKVGSTTDGYWYIALAGNSTGLTFAPITTPASGDVPVPGDYDNVGHAEPAIFRPSAGLWFIKDATSSTGVLHTITLGTTGDIPVPGAYDATSTNHALEASVFRPTTGQWFIRNSAGVIRTYQFKVGDIPAPGDYNGDGITDAVVYRPSTGQWLTYLPGATSATVLTGAYGTGTFGNSTSVPINAPYHYRQVTGAGGTISSLSVNNTGTGSTSTGGSSGGSVPLDLGSTARNLASGTLTPPPASSPTTVSLLKKTHRAKATPKVAIHSRAATVAQNATTKKNPGQLF